MTMRAHTGADSVWRMPQLIDSWIAAVLAVRLIDR
jgi:hypothetical protein